MITEFIFCCALPGAGKSTYLKSHYDNTYDIVSADEIKKILPGYDPENPEAVHEESVQRARSAIFAMCETPLGEFKVILDGGGINNHYNVSIIEKVRETNPDAKITCLFFDTPVEVCIERISHRERKVPISDIYRKNQQIIKCVNRYREMVDEFVRIDYFTNKYLILDMDGTIASYGKSKLDEDGNIDFVNCEQFRWSQPVPHVIEFVKKHFDMQNVFVITACPNSIAWQEKLEWLDKHFPEVRAENRMFVGNKDWKHVFIKHLAIKNKWDLKDVCIVDDFHNTLTKCSAMGMNAVQPSNIEAMFNKEAYQA